ncbi:MAG: NAD(P)-dependent oxidoreductase, partial [Trebonia sp.]
MTATAGRQVGFVGLGNMGGRMTRRLVAAGVRVVGYDTRAGQAASVGAVAAEALGDVCAGTEVVLLSLPDSRAVESVVFGARPESDGLLEYARPGQVIIDLSTSAPSSTQRIHAALAERGVEYLDAGISGGAAAAEKGTLTIMVGGAAVALESVRWVFGPIATKIVLMGDSGAGHSTKLLNNFLNAV